jgi:hypothetical protein
MIKRFMFDHLSDKARIWIYGFRKPLSVEDKQKIDTEFNRFVSGWNTHSVPVQGDFVILEDRFVILAAEDSVSGCSIDSSVSVFKHLQKNYHLDSLDFDLVYYKIGNTIDAVRRDDFRVMVGNGKISVDTEVFDLTLTTLGELRSGRFRIPFEKSWHWRAFKQSA